MMWFTLVFPIVMLMTPLGFVLCMKRAPADQLSQDSIDRARGLMLLLVTCTLVCSGVVVWLWLADVSLSWLIVGFFFPLWFGIAMPIVALRNPNLVHAHPQNTPVRRASLAPRDTTPLVPPALWVVAGAIGAVFLVGILVRPWGPEVGTALGLPDVNELDDTTRAAWIRWLLLYLGMLALTFTMLPLSIGMVRREPEPMDSRNSPELAKAYASLRRFKANGFIWLFGICGTTMYGSAFLLLSWLPPNDRTLIMIIAIGGAVVGSLVGIMGAAFGTIASLKRAKINELLRTLDATAHS